MGRLLVGLAAPRGQIWVEAFAAGGLESLGAPEALERQDYTHLAAGFALVAGTAAIEHAPFVPLPPRAAALSGLALSGLGEAELLYVRTADRAAV